MFQDKILPFIIWIVYSAWSKTWRIRVHEAEWIQEALRSNRPIVFAHWHGDEMALLSVIGKYRACVITSTSKDGQLINSVLRWMKVPTSRGSSTRGGSSALKGLLRLSEAGRNPVLAIDGPKGPYHKVKPGVFEIAKLLQAPILAAGCHCSHAIVFKKAWNKAYLPYPFARIEIVLNISLAPPPPEADARQFSLAQSLEEAMHNASQKAANLIASSKA